MFFVKLMDSWYKNQKIFLAEKRSDGMLYIKESIKEDWIKCTGDKMCQFLTSFRQTYFVCLWFYVKWDVSEKRF